MKKSVITAKILTGSHCNVVTMIPRINLCPSETKFPFNFTRRQFPLRLAYAMTINKSQGQSIKKIGIYLPQPLFSHGQLYVAFSRAENPDNIKVFVENLPNVQGVLPGHEGISIQIILYTKMSLPNSNNIFSPSHLLSFINTISIERERNMISR